MRVDIELDEATLQQLKERATQEGKSVRRLVVSMIKESLDVQGDSWKHQGIHELAQEVREIKRLLQHTGTATHPPTNEITSRPDNGDTPTRDGVSEVSRSATRTANEHEETGESKQARRGVATHYRELFPDKPRLTKEELHSLFSVGKGNADWINNCLDKARNAERPVSYALAILKREASPYPEGQPPDEPDGIDDAAIRIMTTIISDRESEFVTNEVNPIISKRSKARGRAAAQQS